MGIALGRARPAYVPEDEETQRESMATPAALATVSRRLVAYGAGVSFALVALVAVQAVLVPVNPLLRADSAASGAALHAWVTLTVTSPTILGFAAFWASRSGATPGMRLCGIRVRSATGSPLPPVRALLRATVLLIPFELNHLVLFHPVPMWADQDVGFRGGIVAVYVLVTLYLVVTVATRARQGPHDLAAGSVVERGTGGAGQEAPDLERTGAGGLRSGRF